MIHFCSRKLAFAVPMGLIPVVLVPLMAGGCGWVDNSGCRVQDMICVHQSYVMNNGRVKYMQGPQLVSRTGRVSNGATVADDVRSSAVALRCGAGAQLDAIAVLVWTCWATDSLCAHNDEYARQVRQMARLFSPAVTHAFSPACWPTSLTLSLPFMLQESRVLALLPAPSWPGSLSTAPSMHCGRCALRCECTVCWVGSSVQADTLTPILARSDILLALRRVYCLGFI